MPSLYTIIGQLQALSALISEIFQKKKAPFWGARKLEDAERFLWGIVLDLGLRVLEEHRSGPL